MIIQIHVFISDFLKQVSSPCSIEGEMKCSYAFTLLLAFFN